MPSPASTTHGVQPSGGDHCAAPNGHHEPSSADRVPPRIGEPRHRLPDGPQEPRAHGQPRADAPAQHLAGVERGSTSAGSAWRPCAP